MILIQKIQKGQLGKNLLPIKSPGPQSLMATNAMSFFCIFPEVYMEYVIKFV